MKQYQMGKFYVTSSNFVFEKRDGVDTLQDVYDQIEESALDGWEIKSFNVLPMQSSAALSGDLKWYGGIINKNLANYNFHKVEIDDYATQFCFLILYEKDA